jgi:ABC-type transport system involved in multi-copper enzyme maturation permease subunit
MELVRQPVFLLLMAGSASFTIVLASVPYFGLGDDPTLVKNSVLAVTFVTGLFGGIIGSSLSVSREIARGTALAVLAKPVPRWYFVLGKYAGLSLSLLLLVYVNLVASLTASRMAYDAYSGVDWSAFFIFEGSIILALAVAGVRNFVFRRPFLQEAVFNTALFTTVAFVIIWKLTTHKVSLSDLAEVDWRLLPSTILILFAVWILAAVAVVCSTRLEMLPTMGICCAIFMIGLMSDYLFGRAEENLIARFFYTLIPNWQLYWMADAIQNSQSIPIGYMVRAFLQMILNVGWLLVAAVVLFEDRELSA